MSEQQIVVSVIVIRDDEGRVLTVRKRGTPWFMFPGGKPETDESPEQAVVREVTEELGVTLEISALRAIGVFVAAAANEAGYDVRAVAFEHPYLEIAHPRAEIEEIRWVHLGSAEPQLAPLLRDELFPALAR
jgi:8-oxo-dGTP pyrophosphatase MutT (NUDIX family)